MVLTDEIMTYLRRVIEYNYENEKKHFEECEKEQQENHIFNDVKALQEWADNDFN